MNTAPPHPDCLHPTRTVVIIDILWRTRAAMHTAIEAAAVWIISIFLACYHVAKIEKNCAFVGPPFLGAPVRPNMLNMPKSASAQKDTSIA